MKGLKKQLHGKNSYRFIGIVFLVLCLISAVFSFQYYNQLQSAIRGESQDYLKEISRRIGSNINRIIDDNYDALYSTSAIIEHIGADSFSDVLPLIDAQKQYWDYEKVLLIDEKGNAYDNKGQEVVLSNKDYFDALLNKQRSLSTAQMLDNKECIMLIIPVDDLVLDGKKIMGLAATYLPDVFVHTLSMSSFNGQSYSCVMGKTGSIIVRPTVVSELKFGYNILSSLGEAKLDEGDSLETIKNALLENNDAQIGFTQNGVRYYMVSTPINSEGWYLATFVPTHVVNQKSDMLLRVTVILCGLVAAVFAGLIAMLIYVFYHNKRRLEQIAYVDEITNGNTIQKFYQLAQEALEAPSRPQYALVYTNLQKFKVLNEQFGRRTGDMILQAFYNLINSDLKNSECMGRHSADNFCILLEYQNEPDLLKRINQWYIKGDQFVTDSKVAWSLPITEFGVFIIDNDTIPFSQIIDRAKLALKECSKVINSRIHYAIYNHDAHTRLFREKHLEDRMEAALAQNEFQVYLQPKYMLPERKIGGAEALVRWMSPDEGMIYPNEFIPLFEKNGFIVQLDLWVFEEVCKHQRRWIDAGHQPVKISVNCSRVQLSDVDFYKAYETISKKYNVPPELLEIELTESVVMEDVERLGKVIDDIHSMGFGCSMDDFGSGYSSLNLIQSISVDTLKLDKIFFHTSTQDSHRMESVVSSIISMAKALSMDTVAEGVEYPEQIEMLERIGCTYIQGFVFAKPMPVEAFEELAYRAEDESERK